MGHHFLPQRYLRNFEDTSRPGFIWVHDKRKGTIQQGEIEHVAQSKRFYSEKVESTLAREVEVPGNLVIRKLTNSMLITFEERFDLAYYVGVMLRRVPASRRRAKDLAPSVLADLIADMRGHLKSLAIDSRVDPELLARRHRELDAVATKFSHQPPSGALEQFREPWPSSDWFDSFHRMTWRVLTTAGPRYFATTDNPVFFFDAFGLAKRSSELVFPLSTTHALHACWQTGESDLIFVRPAQAIVKEINRRLASTAERLAFYHEAAPWLLKLLLKKDPYLSTIQWRS
jgi:Protein of unknown function (DUF4238)